jgi:organic hydroperoxide reductase OsmC/OhrA
MCVDKTKFVIVATELCTLPQVKTKRPNKTQRTMTINSPTESLLFIDVSDTAVEDKATVIQIHKFLTNTKSVCFISKAVSL